MKVRKQVLGMALGVTAMVAAASMASAQASLPTIWQIDQGVQPFFPGGDVARGMAFNPATGNLLVLSRTAVVTNPNIQVINGATGAVGLPMNASGFSGGTFTANKIQAVDRGAGNYSVYVANLVSSAESTTGSLHPTVSDPANPAFRIYRYTGAGAAAEDTIGASTLIYRNNAVAGVDGYAGGPIGPDMPIPVTNTNAPGNTVNDAYRIGDTMDIAYDSVNNVTRLYFGYRQLSPNTLPADAFLVFTVDEATGTVTSVDRFTTTAASGNSFYSTVPFGANTVYHATNGQFARYENLDATPGDFEVRTIIGNFGNAVVVEPHLFAANGRTWVAYIRGGETTQFSQFRIGEINPAGTLENTFSVQTVGRGAGAVANGNGSGEFHYDAASGRLYGLVGNNIIAAVQFAEVGGPSVKTWDGGAGTANWTDANNWFPDGVPAPTQDVLLDNSQLAGDYQVVTPDTTSVFARTVTVGYPANPNTIELVIPTTSTVAEALHILSSPITGDNDIRVGEGGIIRNSSAAASGGVVWNRNPGATMFVAADGTYEHNTARSFATPFPATGNGAITFDPIGTMIFDVAGGGAFAWSGRTYGHLTFQSVGANYTATGANPALVRGVTTVETGVSVNVSGHTGTQTFEDDLDNNGSLTLGGPATGATLAGGNLVNTAGNSITFANGFEIPAANEFTFNNAGTVITAGTGQVNGDLYFSPTGGTHTLSGQIDINSGASLNLTSGIVDTAAGTLRARIGSSVVVGTGWASPDFTNEVAAAALSAVSFPIGNAVLALPGTITFPSNGPDVQVDITLSTNDGDHPTVSPAGQPTALNRWWNITTNPVLTNGSFGANLDFTIDPATDLLPAINPANLKLAREITPGSGDFISYPSGYAAPVLSTTVPIVGFSDWTAFEDVVLAADVTSFTAKQVGASVLVSWETAAELDNAGFAIYRANADGSRGEKLSGLIPAEGSAEAGASYSFVDAAPFAAGESSRSYLLVDIDLSGAETTHGPATATISTGSPSSVPAWTLY